MDALNLAILPTLPFDVQVRIFKAARRTTVFPIHSLPLCRLSKALFPVIQAQIFQSVVLTRHASGRTQQFFSSLNESINRNDDEALGILVKELEYLKVAQSLYDDDLLTLLPHLPNLTRLKIIFMGNLTKRLAFSFDMLADCVPSLEILVIHRAELVEGTGEDFILPNLHTLDWAGGYIDAEVFQTIKLESMPKLRNLRLTDHIRVKENPSAMELPLVYPFCLSAVTSVYVHHVNLTTLRDILPLTDVLERLEMEEAWQLFENKRVPALNHLKVIKLNPKTRQSYSTFAEDMEILAAGLEKKFKKGEFESLQEIYVPVVMIGGDEQDQFEYKSYGCLTDALRMNGGEIVISQGEEVEIRWDEDPDDDSFGDYMRELLFGPGDKDESTQREARQKIESSREHLWHLSQKATKREISKAREKELKTYGMPPATLIFDSMVPYTPYLTNKELKALRNL